MKHFTWTAGFDGKKPSPLEGGWIRPGGLAIPVLVLAVILGVQLGGLSWRYRRQIWMLQGFAAGAAVGFLTGRFSRRDLGRAADPDD